MALRGPTVHCAKLGQVIVGRLKTSTLAITSPIGTLQLALLRNYALTLGSKHGDSSCSNLLMDSAICQFVQQTAAGNVPSYLRKSFETGSVHTLRQLSKRTAVLGFQDLVGLFRIPSRSHKVLSPNKSWQRCTRSLKSKSMISVLEPFISLWLRCWRLTLSG